MNTESALDNGVKNGTRASWMPLVVIIMAQMLMVFNITTLQVSIDGIASTFNRSATIVGTAIVAYSLVVAGFIMVGAKVARIYGSRRVFRATVLIFGVAMLIMTCSPGPVAVVLAQVLAGAAAAALVPTLVVLATDNYQGEQQVKAVALLGAAQAMGIILALVIAGSVSTLIGWRVTFALLVVLSGVVFWLSEKFNPVKQQSEISIDMLGAVLIAVAIFLISIGCNNLTKWGVLLASPRAPFTVLEMSPAPIMIVCGIFVAQAFLIWSRRRQKKGQTPLVALSVLGAPPERAALFSLFAIGALTSAVAFLIPLYIQVVQGGSSLQTAIAMIPLSAASVAAAVLVVRLHDRVSSRRIARFAFLLATVGVAALAAVIHNDWGKTTVIISMFVLGIGEGVLVSLLFNVLISASPKEQAGDVGSLRGTANNLAAAVGTALASALIVGTLSTSVHRDLAQNAALPIELKQQVNLDDVSFVSNGTLERRLQHVTDATPEQVAEAVRVNTDSRLLALKVSFFTLAGLALLAYFPAGALPGRTDALRPRGAT
jgi:MFS family permease